MAGVRHMVSTVEGRLRPEAGLAELLRATFPGGSVTGAPKVSAIDHIARLEPVGRGASMGALGVVHPNGDLDLGLTIRTLAVADGRAAPVGGRRDRVGLRPGRRGRGVAGQGAAAGTPDRRRAARGGGVISVDSLTVIAMVAASAFATRRVGSRGATLAMAGLTGLLAALWLGEFASTAAAAVVALVAVAVLAAGGLTLAGAALGRRREHRRGE